MNPQTEEEEQDEARIEVKLSACLLDHTPVLRRLYHRVVDLLADYKMTPLLMRDVERLLTLLSTHILSTYVEDLISEAEKEAKAAARAAKKAESEAAAAKPKASTKTESKRKATTKKESNAAKTAKKTKAPGSRRKKVERG